MTRILDRDDFLQVVRHTPLVSIDLVLRDPDGRLLLGLRNNRPAKDCWFVPGGRICKDERLDDAFRRITEDELGSPLERATATLLGVYEHLYPDNVADEPGVTTHYVVLAHRIDVERGFMPRPDDQHREVRWFDAKDAAADGRVHPNTLAYYRDLEGDERC